MKKDVDQNELKALLKEDIPSVAGARIAIIQASWHKDYTTPMVEKCGEILKEAGCTVYPIFEVSGCYEVPLAAKKIARWARLKTPQNLSCPEERATNQPTSALKQAEDRVKAIEVIIVFGAIIKGDTDHYRMILDTCIRELGKIVYDFEIPIINEILPVFKIEDLITRSEGRLNKGIEAAHAAIKAISWHRRIADRLEGLSSY